MIGKGIKDIRLMHEREHGLLIIPLIAGWSVHFARPHRVGSDDEEFFTINFNTRALVYKKLKLSRSGKIGQVADPT